MAETATVISIINYKGGVGKTTIALQLASGLATLHGRRVLVADLDPQCSLSVSAVPEETWIDHIENRGSIRSVLQSYYEGNVRLEQEWILRDCLPVTDETDPSRGGVLDLVPCHLDLPDYEMRLVAERPPHATETGDFERSRHRILRDAIEPLRRKYDYIIFDCPPNIYFVSRNAILASDFYLLPTIPDFISCYGIPFIENHIRTLLADAAPSANRARNLGILRNRVRKSSGRLVREHEKQSAIIDEMYPGLLFQCCIQDRIGIAELMGQRNNLFLEDAHRLAPIREEFEAFVAETLARLEQYSA